MVDALVRSVRFVKGGVSMATLPADDYPEVAFIGRSNVGKSSMVNMVLGRRAIAYTSKTPGKTQQYNYFVLNEAQGGRSGGSSPTLPFHLVDMPGLGFAKVPGAERRKWLTFLGEYAARRPQLKLIVHLIDGQVGPQDTDRAIMRMVRDAEAGHEEHRRGEEVDKVVGAASAVSDLGGGNASGGAGGWQYAVCLTKSDKGGPKALERVVEAVTKAAEDEGWVQPMEIVATSSKTKAGRAAMWRLMRCLVLADGSAASGRPPSDETREAPTGPA
jgi:ribosome biogenesis GTP-binding protein YsxC/EngB